MSVVLAHRTKRPEISRIYNDQSSLIYGEMREASLKHNLEHLVRVSFGDFISPLSQECRLE